MHRRVSSVADSSLVAVVIGLNILMAVLGFYATWRIWQLGRGLRQLQGDLHRWEQAYPQLLPAAAVHQFHGQLVEQHRRYHQLRRQLQLVLQLRWLFLLLLRRRRLILGRRR